LRRAYDYWQNQPGCFHVPKANNQEQVTFKQPAAAPPAEPEPSRVCRTAGHSSDSIIKAKSQIIAHHNLARAAHIILSPQRSILLPTQAEPVRTVSRTQSFRPERQNMPYTLDRQIARRTAHSFRPGFRQGIEHKACAMRINKPGNPQHHHETDPMTAVPELH